MTFYTTILGGIIGTIISVLFLDNANRLGFLPADWNFFNNGVAHMQKTKNRFLLITPRFILGGLAMPYIFYYFWGPTGSLGIDIFGSAIFSAIAFSLVEYALMLIGISFRAFGQPKGTSKNVAGVAFIGHINLAIWIGWFSVF